MSKPKRMITKFDYDRIRNNLNRINPDKYNKSIRILLEKFKNARLIDSKKIKDTIITMNTRFKLRNLGYGYDEEYVLVFPKDSDPEHNKISVFDSAGSELLAHEVGEVVRLREDENSYYLIENIIYQPEAAGDYNL